MVEARTNPPETIKTARLTLRRLRGDDADTIFASYAQNRDVTRFLTWRPHQSVEEARVFVRSCIEAWQAGTEFTWALDQPQIFRVWAVCDVENPASARVMEKAGMIKEGILRKWIRHPQAGDAPRDCFCYSIVKG